MDDTRPDGGSSGSVGFAFRSSAQREEAAVRLSSQLGCERRPHRPWAPAGAGCTLSWAAESKALRSQARQSEDEEFDFALRSIGSAHQKRASFTQIEQLLVDLQGFAGDFGVRSGLCLGLQTLQPFHGRGRQLKLYSSGVTHR